MSVGWVLSARSTYADVLRLVILSQPSSRARVLFLALVALLPLHTVFIRAEIAWKPWLILLIAVAALDVWNERRFPWARRVVIGVAVLLAATVASFPGQGAGTTFWRLWLALIAGGLLLLVLGKRGDRFDDILRAVFWSGAVLGATAFVLAMVTNGVFGEDLVTGINEVPLIERVNKQAYLGTGFVALTNWHQDPGYAALWSNVWLVMAVIAWARGVIRAPRWVGAAVIGGLSVATLLTYSRTGWLGLGIAVIAALLAARKDGAADVARAVRVVVWGAVVGLALLGIQLTVDQPDVGGDVLTAFEFRFAHIGELGAIDLGEAGVVDPDLLVPDNRLEVWGEYWARFTDSPIRGIGLGTGWGEEGLQEPHNLWLELLAETGVLGLLGFIFMLGSLGRRGGPVAGAVLAVVLGASLSQTVLFEPVLWFGLGLWLATSNRSSVEAEKALA